MSMNSQGRYASAFRRVVKRRQALNTASPFACAVLGFADTYLYCQGLLCYTLDDRLRILDLHNSGGNEVVISISNLLQHSIPEVYDSQRGVFEILYASNGIISCLFNRIHCQPRTWLIAFHVESRRTLVVEPFEPNPKIFARQNQRFLYFGTNSGFLIGGFEKWAIKCYDFKRMKWFDKILHVTDIGGSEIGSTICFEVVNDALIAVTNRASWRDEGVDCVSFYSCFSFRPIRGRLETLAESAWRRYHAEGPIDDRWTSLHLEIDETGGFVKIVESRKEWYKGSSTSGLRYYTTNFAFHEVAVREMQHDMPITTRMKEKHSQLPVSFLVSHDSNPPEPNSGSLTLEDSTQFTEKAEALIRLLRREDHPHHLPLPLRTVDMVHPVRHGSSEPTFTQAKIKGRYYSAPASTVLYLVDDPLPTDWQGRQRLRLRVDSRSLGPPLQDRDGFWVKHLPYDLSLALGSMYISSPITFWPPSQYPGFDQADESVDKIYGILNPPAFLGNVKSTTDERSLVYTTGDINGPQAIVFISFDPAIKLQGLKKWESGRRPVRSYVDVGELDRTVILGRVGRPADTSSKGAKVIISSTKLVAISEPGREVECESGLREFRRGDSVDWIWKESAMYRDVGRGYDFGL
jgi:hypothetical protein